MSQLKTKPGVGYAITDPPPSQALTELGRSSRGISSGSTKSRMERAFPRVRLTNPFSESVTSI
jgi:hypothetical protein